jgi:hypothetical protein
VRLLAISSPERTVPGSPPTIRESGLDVTVSNWRAVVAPPGTDTETQTWLVQALARMRQSASWQETVRRNDWVDSFLAGPELETFIEAETESNTKVLAGIGLVNPDEGTAQYAAVGPWLIPAVVIAGLIFSVALSALGPGARSAQLPRIDGSAALQTACLLFAYVLLLNPLGFLIATAAFLFVQAHLLGSRRWLRNGVFGLVTSFVIYALFNVVLKIGLPSGLLG